MRYLVIDLKSCRVKWFDNVLVSGIPLQFVELLYSIKKNLFSAVDSLAWYV